MDTTQQPADSVPMMSLTEFAKKLKRRPIKLVDAEAELARYGLKIAFHFKQGRSETGLLIRSEAEQVIAEQARTAPKSFGNTIDRTGTLDEILLNQSLIITDLAAIREHLGI